MDIESSLREFYNREELVITRRTKRGISDSDIKPMIKSIQVSAKNSTTVSIEAVIAAQNPSLNPEHLVNALRQLKAEIAPDFAAFRRKAFLDAEMKPFI